MISFFGDKAAVLYVIGHASPLTISDKHKLEWLFGYGELTDVPKCTFVGPRKEMISPWSTNAVEITQNIGIDGIFRIEKFHPINDLGVNSYDPMLQQKYTELNQAIFTSGNKKAPVQFVEDIGIYNKVEGLALNSEEVKYLSDLSERLGRSLTDSEVFGFSQVNSEHCRHKIFNGIFIIDGEEKGLSLFDHIKLTTKENRNKVVSAYKDNVTFISGPIITEFAPERPDIASFFRLKEKPSVISLKAETHNFPTTVEPFNGAATGTGGEIRDRLAGGKGSLPIAGTAVYMTSYPRTEEGRSWEVAAPSERQWLYHTPEEILIKASNGASDFGNKFGQPLICGSLLTFEQEKNDNIYGYDKVIMLAGGIGYGYLSDADKDDPKPGQAIVVLGGDNYRIGMGGSSVSSVNTGELSGTAELNAVQRSNPEMQKRVANTIRGMIESDANPIISIHDHGAGGHLNSLSELVEKTGGIIDISKLPIGDPTLSAKEVIGNESQERMGLIINESDLPLLQKVANREKAPLYVVGKVTGDYRFVVTDPDSAVNPIDLELADMFGNPPQTVLEDKSVKRVGTPIPENLNLKHAIETVISIEAVACKDWLTNKVDRSVTGKVAMQQTTGQIQLPLNNVAVVALDFYGASGIATSIGHAPVAALIDPSAGSRLAVAEALTNLIWAPLTHGIKGVSLSANWMWPCRNAGEDARLYEAVEAISKFCIDLGINIPTGKDSLSMTQKYPDGTKVISPGTVIISAVAEVSDIKKCITPDIKPVKESKLVHIDFSTGNYSLGGSTYSQTVNKVGVETPDATSSSFSNGFKAVQELINKGYVLAGHDISAGGIITTLLEMCFPTNEMGIEAEIFVPQGKSSIAALFTEQPGVVIQCNNIAAVKQVLKSANVAYQVLGQVTYDKTVSVQAGAEKLKFTVQDMRKIWFKSSYLLDIRQSGIEHAELRYKNHASQPLEFKFPQNFQGTHSSYKISRKTEHQTGIKAGVIREKGINGDREMAWALHLAGFDVKDIHMTDLMSGEETLDDLHLIVFTGGFSNSDVLGSAKGWAGSFMFNPKAKAALEKFYARHDTLSLGVCNGCQLMVALGLIYPEHNTLPSLHHNKSGKFESAFVNVDIPNNHSIMLNSLAGTRLGIWIAHGEGRFSLPLPEDKYHIPMKYSYNSYPGNPNGSDYNTAAICSADGRHLAVMPHFERAIYPWNWAYYPWKRDDELTPWIEAFINAKEWIKKNK